MKPLLHAAIGARLTRLRMRRGWTIEALAIASAMSAEDIARYEHGARMSIEQLWRIAKALRVSPSAFFMDVAPLDRTVTPTAVDVSEGVALIKAFCAIHDAHLRHLLIDIADHFAHGDNG